MRHKTGLTNKYFKKQDAKTNYIQTQLIKNKIFHNRKAISDIMATLFLLSITMVGATIVYAFFLNSNMGTMFTDIPNDRNLKSVLLVGYDTRDSTGLSKISGLDNKKDTVGLCTTTCTANKDLTPANGGTDFIVLKIRNTGTDNISISRITINSINHEFDFQTANANIVATTNAQSCTVSCPYPKSGKFSVISANDITPLVQKNTPELVPNGEARYVIKLSSSILSDIKINQAITIKIDTGRLQQASFIIPSGGAS